MVADGVVDNVEMEQLLYYVQQIQLLCMKMNMYWRSKNFENLDSKRQGNGEDGVGIVLIIKNELIPTFILSDTLYTSILTDNTSNTGLLRIGDISNLNDISDISCN